VRPPLLAPAHIPTWRLTILRIGLILCRVQEMATEFPHVDFVSLDVSPMTAHIPRENITFEVYDLYAGLAEADASFDMVHVRLMDNKVCSGHRLWNQFVAR
jgi:hypothetical protein